MQAALKKLTKPEGSDNDEELNFWTSDANTPATSQPPELLADKVYLEALLLDPVALVRTLIRDLRASRQRRDDFLDVIKKGNADGSFSYILPLLQLLRDMDVRWSSTYLMIRRFLLLYPVRTSSILVEQTPS